MQKLVLLIALTVVLATKGRAQSEEAQQLLLNVEKLAQLKQILNDLKKGYMIISSGYNNIKNISEGNFNLHKTFLDHLLAVSPTVRDYKKIIETVNAQIEILHLYKSAYARFTDAGNFSSEELGYLKEVYSNLFDQSAKDLEALTNIITANQLRMSDDERLKAIDDIFNSMQDKLLFLRVFNNRTTILAIQRIKERKNSSDLRKIYGVK